MPFDDFTQGQLDAARGQAAQLQAQAQAKADEAKQQAKQAAIDAGTAVLGTAGAILGSGVVAAALPILAAEYGVGQAVEAALPGVLDALGVGQATQQLAWYQPADVARALSETQALLLRKNPAVLADVLDELDMLEQVIADQAHGTAWTMPLPGVGSHQLPIGLRVPADLMPPAPVLSQFLPQIAAQRTQALALGDRAGATGTHAELGLGTHIAAAAASRAALPSFDAPLWLQPAAVRGPRTAAAVAALRAARGVASSAAAGNAQALALITQLASTAHVNVTADRAARLLDLAIHLPPEAWAFI